MVYKFDPAYVNGTVFTLGDWDTLGDHLEARRANEPIPASYFPQSLTVIKATQALPDIFHASRAIIVVSERARGLIEKQAPGQVEFIPVAIHADPDIARRLRLANAYYFVNVLGRAQRFQWLEMQVRPFQASEDGIQRFGAKDDYREWNLRKIQPGDPVIWCESWWRFSNKEYRRNVDVLVEDVLWRAISKAFPGQLNALRVGTSVT